MRYKVWIKTCEQEISGEFENGGIDANGNTTSNDYAIRTKNFIEIYSSRRYKVIIRNGLTLEIHCYDSNKNQIHKETYSAPIVSGSANTNDRVISNFDLSINGNAKFVKMVLHRYNSGMYVPEEKLYATAVSLIDPSSIPTLIHDSLNPDKSYHLKDPNLTLSDSSAGSFDFSIDPKHFYYENGINLITDTVYVERWNEDGSKKIIWDGRPISEVIGWDKIKTIHCEGALAYLNDSRVSYALGHVIHSTIYEYIKNNIIHKHNTIATDNYARQDRTLYYNASSNPPLEDASIYINRGQSFDWWPNFEGSLQWLNDYIIGSFGGHMKIRYNDTDEPGMKTISRKLTMIQKFDYVETINAWSNSYSYSYGDLVWYNNNIYFAMDRNGHSAGTGTPGNSNGGWYNINQVSYSDLPQKDTIKTYSSYGTWEPIKWRFSEAHIDFGKNLLDYSKTDSISEIATRIIPRGKTVEDPNDRGIDYYVYLDAPKDAYGEPVADSDRYETAYLDDKLLQYKYGIIEACVDFDDAENPKTLMKNAQEWFSDLKKKIIDSVIEISILDLGNSIIPSESSDPFCDSKYIDLWTRVYVTAKPFGLQNEEYYVTEISIPLDDPAGTQITLTSKNKLLTDSNISNGLISGTKKGVIDHNIN